MPLSLIRLLRLRSRAAITLPNAALAVWGVVAFVVIGRGLLAGSPAHDGIYPVYAKGGADWLAGRTVYPAADGFNVFRYHPLFAAGFAALAWLPLWVGSTLWRILLVGVVYSSLRRWLQVSGPAPGEARTRDAVLILIAPLLAWDMVDGQTNSLIAAFLLRAVASATEERPWSASLWLALASLLKLFPLGFAALLIAARPKSLALRFVAATAALSAVPFLLQDPAFVARQYGEWFATFTADGGRQHYPLSLSYRDLRFLFRLWDEPLPAWAFQAAAGSFWLASLIGMRVLSSRAAGDWNAIGGPALALGGIGMTLLGPCTEIVTYAILAPAIAAAAWQVQTTPISRWMSLTFQASYVLLAASFLSFLFPFGSSFSMLGPQPLSAGLFALAAVPHFVNHLRTTVSDRAIVLPFRRSNTRLSRAA